MADEAFDAVVELPCAGVGLRLHGDLVAEIRFLPRGTPPRAASRPGTVRASAAIRAYLDDPALPVDMPLLIQGSVFQGRVWAAIASIPSGQTRTYGELARAVGGTARAIGQACGDNRLPIAIPCHRVVSSGGPGGFAHRTDDAMLGVKRWLLEHEGRAAFALAP